VRFQLEPYNRGLSDDELLEDLRSVAQKLGKQYVTKNEYDEHGRLSAAGLQKRFGSWCKAHDRAGLRRIRNYDATVEDCLSDLKSVAAKLGKSTLTTADYKPHGRYSLPLIADRCGSFKEALALADLSRSANARDKLTDEQLFENLEHLWEALGRQPTQDDYVKPLSRYSRGPYIRRFGSYRKALEAFVASFEAASGDAPEEPSDSRPARMIASVPLVRHRTPRNPSWRGSTQGFFQVPALRCEPRFATRHSLGPRSR
jgi:hypothetical protein